MDNQKGLLFVIVEKFVSLLFWLKIVIAPIIISMVLAGLLYLWLRDKGIIALVCSIIIIVAGAIIGVIWAERVRKRVGTEVFGSKVMSSNDITDMLANKQSTKNQSTKK